MKQLEAWNEPSFIILPSPMERVLFYTALPAYPNLKFNFVPRLILKKDSSRNKEEYDSVCIRVPGTLL